ncbi:MAG TPA: hypothetical protein VES62_07735 [Thermoleophilaceae bacterium]|nr:hypothetical protein [Thermoleophilaceae bacterium]
MSDEWEVTWVRTGFDLPWLARLEQIAWAEIEWTVRERDDDFNLRSIQRHRNTLQRWHRPIGGFLPLLNEYNWRDQHGNWRRLYADVTDGCHRLLAVRELGMARTWVSAGNFKFQPPDRRPLDRFWIPRRPDRETYGTFDSVARSWSDWPGAPHRPRVDTYNEADDDP